MNLDSLLAGDDRILSDGSMYELLRRSPEVDFDPHIARRPDPRRRIQGRARTRDARLHRGRRITASADGADDDYLASQPRACRSVDFLQAATLPALSEARGIAQATAASGLP